MTVVAKHTVSRPKILYRSIPIPAGAIFIYRPVPLRRRRYSYTTIPFGICRFSHAVPYRSNPPPISIPLHTVPARPKILIPRRVRRVPHGHRVWRSAGHTCEPHGSVPPCNTVTPSEDVPTGPTVSSDTRFLHRSAPSSGLAH